MTKPKTFTDGGKIPVFQVPNRTAHLTFEGTDWEGADVIVRLGISIDTYFQIKRLVDDNEPMLLAKIFGDTMLAKWNLVDDQGQAIPPTGDGMASLPDMVFALRIISQWLEAVAGVPAPLGGPSPDGNTLVAVSTALANE